MECPKGSMCTEGVHEVITIKKGLEWFPDIVSSDLPIRIHQYKASNGRLTYKVFNSDNQIIYGKG